MDKCSLCNKQPFRFKTIAFVECRNQDCTMNNIRIGRKAFDDGVMDRFFLFWESYPVGRKKGKVQAVRTWLKLNPSEALTGKIIEGLVRHIFSEEWEDLKYVPHASTFLNARGWEDEVVEKDVAKKVESFNSPIGGWYKSPDKPKQSSNASWEEVKKKCRNALKKK